MATDSNANEPSAPPEWMAGPPSYNAVHPTTVPLYPTLSRRDRFMESINTAGNARPERGMDTV